MDIRTARRLEETFTRVDLLMAALESLTRALNEQHQRITELEDKLAKGRQQKWPTTKTS